MKKIIFILCISFSTILAAQNSLAKIEYSYAEEAFGKEEYSKALKHLEEVKSLLGNTNARVMYLEINSLMNTLTVVGDSKEDYLVYNKINDLTTTYLINFENYAPIDKVKNIYEIQKKYEDYSIEAENLIKGIDYFNSEDYENAKEYFLIACESGNPEACKNIAKIYSDKQDYVNFKKFIEKSITLGSLLGKNLKGHSLYYGLNGYTQNISQAVKILEEAYSSGMIISSSVLGEHYINSNKEKSKALLLVSYNQLKQKRAALFLYYYHKVRNEKILADALEIVNYWLKTEPNNQWYNHYKGFLLLQNKPNFYSGIKYYKLACENGHAFSCNFIGDLYYKKRDNPYLGTDATYGVYRNKKKGKEYLQKACSLDPKYCRQ